MNSSRSTQGLIATHNPGLFQELFDSPSPEMGDAGDKSLHKLYVDGIEGEHFTEEDEDKYKFISDKIEDFDEKQYRMLLDSSRKDDNSRGQSQAGYGRSRNGPDAPTSRRTPSKPRKTQFVMKDRRRHMTEEERDLEELRQEERYQARLRQKLQELEETQNVFIPKLELGDSDDDEQKVKKKNTQPMDISLRDSLEDVPPKAAPHRKEPEPEERGSLEHKDSLEEQQPFVQDSLEFNVQPPQAVDEYQPQPGVHGNDPLSRMFYPDEGAAEGSEWNHQNVRPEEGHLAAYRSDHRLDQSDVQPSREYPADDAYGHNASDGVIYDQHYESHEPEPEEVEVINQAELYDNVRRKYSQRQESQNNSGVRRFKRQESTERPKPDVDFVERNKQLQKQKEGKSYSALHAKKKEPETLVKPSSAEQIWHGRSQEPPVARAGGLGYRAGPGYSSLRKYPSESRVDEMKLQRARHAPHRVGPMAHRPVPIEAFPDPAQAAYPQNNTQHPMYDGGQSPHQRKAQSLYGDAPPLPYASDNYDQHRYDYYGNQGHPEEPSHPYDYHGYGIQGAPGYSDAHGYNYPPHGNQNHYGDGYYDYGQTTHQYNYRRPYQHPHQDEWSQPSVGGSYRGSVTITERSQTPISSPYKILPPISLEDAQNDSVHRAKASPRHEVSPGREAGSYMEAFRSKKNKKTDYKKYTINDYRKLNLEVQRGGLGPEVDGEEYRQRKEKIQRQQEYARIIAEKNRKEMEVAKARPGVIRRPEDDDNDDAFQRRLLAKEYAKSVPKPKPRSKPPSGAPSSGSSTQRSNTSETNRGDKLAPSSGVSRHEKTPLVEMVDLEALQKRHEEEKRQAEMIRQNVEGVH